jgi:hypothetical protein
VFEKGKDYFNPFLEILEKTSAPPALRTDRHKRS